MAQTAYGTNDPEAVKLWSRKLAREAMANTYFGKFAGKGGDSDNSLVVIKEDMKKDMGDEVTMTLRMQLDGEGVQGDNTLEGNEEALSTFTDKLKIDQLRHAVRSKGKMSEQRIPFKHRNEAMQGLRDWWSTRMDRWFFNQLCGFTGGKVIERGETYNGQDTRYTGNQPVLAPDASAHFRGKAAGMGLSQEDEGLVAADTFKLAHIDDLVAVAETRAPIIRPIKYQGENVYVMFIDTLQARDLRKDAGANEWKDIQKAAMQGGNVKKNPIFTGALGMYNNVILHKSNRVTPGVSTADGSIVANVRRSVLCGAQSICLAYGQGHGQNKYDWTEELFDYGNQLGVEGGCIGGMKKSRYDGKDFGTLVLSTYAAPTGA